MGTGNNEGSTMFPTLRIERVLELPQVLSANTLYLVKPDTSNEMTLVATGFTAEIIGQTNSTVEAVLAQLGTSAQYDVSINGDALIDQVVLGSDSRLSDARPPLSHSHTAGELIAILGSANASDLGVSSQAGISELAAREDHVHKRPTAAEVGAIPVSEIGQSVAPVVNGKVPSQFLPESGAGNLGTAANKDVAVTGDASATEVVMGNDSRLTDAREPVSHTHTYYELADLISWESNPRPLGTPTWGVVPWASRADHVHPLPSLATLGAQAENVILNALSSVIVNTADRLIYSTGANEFNTTPLSYFARVLLGAVDEANARTVLGLNSSATLAADTDGTLSANSDTRLATQKAVKTYVDSLVGANDAMVFKGVIDASTNPNYPAANTGYTYRISVGGKIGGVNGPVVENGDIIICQADNVISGNHATVGTNWCIIQVNLDGALTLSNIGTTVQAFDTTLAALAGVPTAADKLIYANGVDSFLTTDFTAFARTILASPDAAALRSALGLGTASTKNVPVSGAASATEVVLGNDPRLSDSRTPLSHSHTAGELIGLLGSTAGTALGTASSGSANTAARSDHVHRLPTATEVGAQPYSPLLTGMTGAPTAADRLIYANGVNTFTVTPLTAHARTMLSNVDPAATRSTLGLGGAATKDVPSSGNAGTGQVVMGNDTRLTDARTPLAHSHTTGELSAILGNSNGTALGTAAPGVAGTAARSDHVHPAPTAASIGAQPLDATLTALAAVTTAADRMIYATGPDTFSTTWITALSRLLLSSPDDATARSYLGLNSASTLTASTDGTLAGNSDSFIATQKAVKTYVDNLISANDAMVYKGAINASLNPTYPAAQAGHTYRISAAGKLGGASGATVEVGDIAICYVDNTPSGDHSAVGANWNIIQVNIDGVLSSGAIGTTVQPYDATLTALAGVTTSADKLIYATGVDTFSTVTLTPFVRSILDDTDAATVRGTIGLGSASVKDAPASGNATATQVVMGNDTRLTDARTPLAHNHDGSYEPVVTAGTTAQYYRGDKSFQDLGTAVRGSAMTGMSTVDSTAVVVTDSLLTAVGKLQAQVNGKQAALTSGTNIKTVNGVSLLGSGNINTGDVSSTTTNTFQQQQTFNAAVVEKHIDLGTGVNFNLALANSFSKTMTVAQTFTVSNVPASGNSVAVILNLTNAGNFTPTFWANVKWPGGTVPTFTINGKDVVGLYTYDGGATWTGLILGKDVK